MHYSLFPCIMILQGNKEYFVLEDDDMPVVAQRMPEHKRVTITSKRQFTIPQKFYTDLGFDKEAVCIKGEDFLIKEKTKG